MRTTIDLPEDLFRRAKSRAALEGLKLKDFIATCLEQRLARGSASETVARQRSPVPLARPATGRTLPLLGSEDIEALLLQEDLEHAHSNRSS